MDAKMIADLITVPGSTPVFSNPHDFGMTYEDVVFQSSDGVNLSGWLIKGNQDKVIIFSHFGLSSSRSGYTPKGKGDGAYDKEINYLNTFRHLISEGYTVLTYDFRNHGNSEKGSSAWYTGGVEESRDVIAAVDFIANHPDYRDSSIGLLSFCNGCNSTTYAFGADDGLRNYKNIRALFAMQPIPLATFLQGFGIPNDMIQEANELNLARGGRDLYASFREDVKHINVPTILVQGKGDPWYSQSVIDEYYDSLTTEKEMLWLVGPNHRLAYYDWFNHSPEKMIEFFNRYM